MRMQAYDNKRWWDFDTERNFHKSCTDFLKIVFLTEAQEAAKEMKAFLTSDMLKPRYVPAKHAFIPRKLNHFHVFWNVMHQLPFFVKKYDKKTQARLIHFYGVGIRDSLPCKYCQKHYIKWLKDWPVKAAVVGKKELSEWLFKLHDFVNYWSKKPSFKWSDYERRWAPKEHLKKEKAKAESAGDEESKQEVSGAKDAQAKNSFEAQPNWQVNHQPTGIRGVQQYYPRAVNYENGIPVFPADVQFPQSSYAPVYGNGQYRVLM